MTQTAHAIAALLQHEMPEITVKITDSFSADNSTLASHGPVMLISEGRISGLRLSLHAAPSDDLTGLAVDIFRMLNRAHLPVGLVFQRMEAIIDEAEFRVGERLVYAMHEHQAAA